MNLTLLQALMSKYVSVAIIVWFRCYLNAIFLISCEFRASENGIVPNGEPIVKPNPDPTPSTSTPLLPQPITAPIKQKPTEPSLPFYVDIDPNEGD